MDLITFEKNIIKESTIIKVVRSSGVDFLKGLWEIGTMNCEGCVFIENYWDTCLFPSNENCKRLLNYIKEKKWTIVLSTYST